MHVLEVCVLETSCVWLVLLMGVLRLKACHLDDVESMRENLRGVIREWRLAKGSVRGAVSEMKRL